MTKNEFRLRLSLDLFWIQFVLLCWQLGIASAVDSDAVLLTNCTIIAGKYTLVSSLFLLGHLACCGSIYNS